MIFFKTKYQRIAFLSSILSIFFVLGSLLIFGFTYKDPPEEYGVLLALGTMDMGSGDALPQTVVTQEGHTADPVPQEDLENPLMVQEESDVEVVKEPSKKKVAPKTPVKPVSTKKKTAPKKKISVPKDRCYSNQKGSQAEATTLESDSKCFE